MFKVIGTQHVLAVNDLAAMERFFIEKLGFAARFRVAGWSFLNLQGFRVMLGHCADALPARELGDHSYFAYVNCENIDSLYAVYQERGVNFTQPVADKPWGLREFGIVTPEGHRIMFGQELAPAN